MAFHFENCSAKVPAASATTFTLSAPPHCDIWCKPPHHNVFTAPVLYKLITLSQFKSCRTTITAGWTELYDQGGLILVFPQPDGSKKWIKAGIEMFNGKPYASTVSADKWADLCLNPLDSATATIEFERVSSNGKLGPTLWIYLVDKTGRHPIREVTWAFEESESNRIFWIGAYAARPKSRADKQNQNLEVSFTDFEIG